MHAVVVRVISRFLLLAVVLVVPVLLAVASQAMTREPGPPDLPTAPIEVSLAPPAPPSAPAPSPSAPEAPPSVAATPSAETGAGEPDVIRQPVPTPGGDDADDDDAGDDGDD